LGVPGKGRDESGWLPGGKRILIKGRGVRLLLALWLRAFRAKLASV
jgi:hypothetical protein